MPPGFSDRQIRRRGHIVKIVPADRSHEKIARDRPLCACRAKGQLFSVGGDEQTVEWLQRAAYRFNRSVAGRYAIDRVVEFLDARLIRGGGKDVRQILPLNLVDSISLFAQFAHDLRSRFDEPKAGKIALAVGNLRAAFLSCVIVFGKTGNGAAVRRPAEAVNAELPRGECRGGRSIGRISRISKSCHPGWKERRASFRRETIAANARIFRPVSARAFCPRQRRERGSAPASPTCTS